MADPRPPGGGHDDDRLLDALAVALRPAPSEPSMAELAALRSVVDEVQVGAVRRRSGRRRRWVAGLLVGGVVLSGGTAYATNPVAPRPVRSAAFALKLPVEPPELTDAKDALEDLEEELREGRRDQVAAAVEDVEEELADLSPDARRALEPRASTLLATAASFLAESVDDVEDDDADDDEVDDSSGRGSGGSTDELDDSSGRGSSGSDSSGSGSSGSGSSGSGDLEDSSGSGSSGSGRGSDDNGLTASGGDRTETIDEDDSLLDE